MTEVAYGVIDAGRRVGLGRTRMYELMAAGEIRSVKSGRRRLIPAAALAEYIARLETEQMQGGDAA